MDKLDILQKYTSLSVPQSQQLLDLASGDIKLALRLYLIRNPSHQSSAFPTNLISSPQYELTSTNISESSSNIDLESICHPIHTPFSFISDLMLNHKREGTMKQDETMRCAICLCDFEEQDTSILRMGRCNDHFFHKECLESCQGDSEHIKCPICGQIYGVMIGDMTKGTLSIYYFHPGVIPCDGYEDVGTYQIYYRFPDGIKGDTNFTGTKRVAFFPDTREATEVMRLFLMCFERRLSFTVGTSVTTGRENCVIWNGVHHKTCPSGGAANFGYPDLSYFSRVKEELAAKGIFPINDSSNV